jgi:hypothetical protein
MGHREIRRDSEAIAQLEALCDRQKLNQIAHPFILTRVGFP